MIFPPPWDLSRNDASKLESSLPKAAVDKTTYPPYRLVWCIEVFDKKDDSLVREIVLKGFDVEALRKIFRRPPSDPMIGGVWPVKPRHRRKLELLTRHKMRLLEFDYFIAASALNYPEFNHDKS
jgi:hypothetical protein